MVFNNNILLQWGFSTGTSNTFTTITFPVAYSNTLYCVQGTETNDAHSQADWNCCWYNKTKTSVQITRDDTCIGFSWFTIGY